MPETTEIIQVTEAAGKQSEARGIGLLRERSLHKELRAWYFRPGDLQEVRIEGYVIDLVRGEELIEIQTRNFSAIKFKLKHLVAAHRVRLVFPISVEKQIVKINLPDEVVLDRRKSPKTGTLVDLFSELVRIPDLINHENFTLQVLMIREEEVRCADGKGSWRRKGVSVINRKLLQVIESFEFTSAGDFRKLLPLNLPEPFTNNDLAGRLKIPAYKVRRMTYCLEKMGVLTQAGRHKNSKLFQINKST